MTDSIIVDSDEQISVYTGEVAEEPHFYLYDDMFKRQHVRRRNKISLIQGEDYDFEPGPDGKVRPQLVMGTKEMVKRGWINAGQVDKPIVGVQEMVDLGFITQDLVGRSFSATYEMTRGTVTEFDIEFPNFGVQELGKFFFGRGSHWVRWRYRPSDNGEFPHGYFVLNGEVLQPKITPAGYRYYTLADVERMAHALAQNGAIDGSELVNVVTMVVACARIYGVDVRAGKLVVVK